MKPFGNVSLVRETAYIWCQSPGLRRSFAHCGQPDGNFPVRDLGFAEKTPCSGLTRHLHFITLSLPWLTFSAVNGRLPWTSNSWLKVGWLAIDPQMQVFPFLIWQYGHPATQMQGLNLWLTLFSMTTVFWYKKPQVPAQFTTSNSVVYSCIYWMDWCVMLDLICRALAMKWDIQRPWLNLLFLQ